MPTKDDKQPTMTAEDAAKIAASVAASIRANYTDAHVVELIPGNLVAMDMLEDAIVGLPQEWGCSHRPEQEMMVNSGKWPADVCTCITNHWNAWDEHRHTLKSGKEGGVLLVQGGPAAVDAEAARLKKENPNWNKPKGKRSRRGSGSRSAASLKGGDQKKTILYCSFNADRANFPDWPDEDLVTIDYCNATGDAKPFLQVIKRRLEEAGMTITDFYGIFHCRDVYVLKDALENTVGNEHAIPGQPKQPHVHWAVRAGSRKGGLTGKNAAKALGLDEEHEKLIQWPDKRQGKYSWEDQISYFTHAKYPEKTRYRVDEVITLAGIDFAEIAKERMADWERQGVVNSQKDYADKVPWLRAKCATGEIILKDIFKKVNGKPNELYMIYTSSKKTMGEIKSVCEAYVQFKMNSDAEDLKAGEFEKATLYFFGPEGTGKSIMISALCDFFGVAYGWRFARLGQKNAGDQVNAQEIHRLDDVYGDALPDISTWVGYLDPHNPCTLPARYFNRENTAPHLVLISANVDPRTFFANAPTGEGAASVTLGAALRRIPMAFHYIDPWTYGMYNVRVFTPKPVDPYTVYLREDGVVCDENNEPDKAEIKRVFRRNRYAMQQAHGRFTPYATIPDIVRYVDATAGQNKLRDTCGLDAAIRTACATVRDRYAMAIRAGAMPDWPDFEAGFAMWCPIADAKPWGLNETYQIPPNDADISDPNTWIGMNTPKGFFLPPEKRQPATVQIGGE